MSKMVRLSLDVAPIGDALPTEILLLRNGLNRSTKGDILFDELSAANVMVHWREHAGDNIKPGMIDLEHLSLDDWSVNFDPDARGWFDLELRDDGLWMVNIVWTDDGAERIRSKKRRYLSPTFAQDHETGRVTKLFNVALTALPALYDAPELVAAAARKEKGMDEEATPNMEEQVAAIMTTMVLDPTVPSKLAEALGLTPDATIDDIVGKIDEWKQMMEKVKALLAGEEESAKDPESPSGTADEGVSSQSCGTGDEKEKASILPALQRITGQKSLSSCLATVERWRKDAVERAQWQRDRATIELAERRDLVGQLVKLRAETPYTAWKLNAAGVPDGLTPVQRLANEPLASLRARVSALAGNKSTGVDTPREPTNALSQREKAICKAKGISEEAYIEKRRAIARMK